MSTQALIRLNWQEQQVSLTQDAHELRGKALELAALIGKVYNAEEQDEAVKAQQAVADALALVEKARKIAKEPALEFCRRIDEVAKSFVVDLKEEQLRLGRLVGDFQQLQQAKARAAEQARLAEERRIAEEKRQAELAALRAAAAEREKLAAQEREIKRLELEARSKREAEALAAQKAEIERQKALAEAKSHEELDRINGQYSQAMADLADKPKFEPARAQGQRVVEDWDITVTDVWALARAHPACVDIRPLNSQIKGLLKAGVAKIPGVIANPVVKAGVTLGRATAAIDV